MKSIKTISIVIPVLNEEKNLPLLYKKLIKNIRGNKYELIFVNDGSTDNSEAIIQSLRENDINVKLITLTRNFGHQIAITCGIDFASGDAAIIIDADLQDPPELIPKMIQKWNEGFDVVYGKRVDRLGESYFKIITAGLFYKVIYLLSGGKIPQNVGDFRLISKKVINVLRETREYQRFLRGIIGWTGFKQIGIEFERAKRYSGSSKYNLLSMVKFALDGILSFSFFPLRIASYLGMLTALGAVFLIFYTIFVTAQGTTVRGWPSTIVIILFIGSIQLIAIGIIGEYLGRIYEEVKRRPLYIIDKSFGIDKKQI
jgi:dolichol-phosphate mannosyltransferase